MAHTEETMAKTTKSYLKAFRKLTKLYGPLHLDGCGYSNRLGDEYRAIGVPQELAAKKATGSFQGDESLFEYGRPKLVQEGWWIMRSSFFTLKLYHSAGYEISHIDGGKMNKDQQSIRCKTLDRSFGLKNWSDNRGEILEIAKLCPKAIRAQINAAVAESDEDIARWKDALKQVASSSLVD